MSSIVMPMCHAWASTASVGVLEHAQHVRVAKSDVGSRTQLESNMCLGSKALPLQVSGYHGANLDCGYFEMQSKLQHGESAEEVIQEEKVIEFDVANELRTQSSHIDNSNVSITCSQKGKHWQALSSLLGRPGIPSFEDFALVLFNSRDLLYVRVLHIHACAFGLESDNGLGNHFVPVFVGCGGINDAQQIYSKLAYPNKYSWSALAQGFIVCGELQRALSLHQNGRLDLDCIFLTMLLKACALLHNAEKGRGLHAELVQLGTDGDLFVGNSLIYMYAKCGDLEEAREVFEKLGTHNVVSWTTLIGGYVEFELFEEALFCLDSMQMEGVPPSAVTYVCSLKACGGSRAIDRGRKLHSKIVSEGMEPNMQVGNTLIQMYMQCASLAEAEYVFYGLSIRDVFSWTALLKGYSEQGACEEALASLEKMRQDGVSPNSLTYSHILRLCKNTKAKQRGFMIHSALIKEGIESNSHLGTTLLDMYGALGSPEDAQHVFDVLPSRNTISWNALIGAYANSGFGDKALRLFEEMRFQGFLQDSVTYMFTLKASSSTGMVDKGKLIHGEIAKEGFEMDPCVGSTLVDMYAKHGCVVEAWETFSELPVRDVVSWTAVLGGFTELNLHKEALNCLEHMQLEEVLPNAFTFGFALKACAGTNDIDQGLQLHNQIIKLGLEKNVFIFNALMDTYSRCGSLFEAERVFVTLSSPDVLSWNILLEGYAAHGLGEDCLICFDLMQQEGVEANAYTFICALSACGSLRDLERGQAMYSKIVEEGLEEEPHVGNSLVDMYSKCCSVAGARQVFEDLSVRDVVSWNALITGYVDCGHCSEGLVCFEQMSVEDGILPDSVTYVATLRACNNLRDIDRGYRLHAELVQDGFEEDASVVGTLVSMYVSCGFFVEAKDIIGQLSVGDVVTWTALMIGYADCGQGEEALKILQQMQVVGVIPNAITYSSGLKACRSIGAEYSALKLQSEILKRGFDEELPLIYV